MLLVGAVTVAGMFTGHTHPLGPPLALLGVLAIVPLVTVGSFWIGATAPTVTSANRRMGAIVAVLLFGWPFSCGFLQQLSDAPESLFVHLIAADPIVAAGSPLYALMAFSVEGASEWKVFSVVGVASLVWWNLLAWFLWRRLPRRLDTAFHGHADRPR